MKEEKGVALLTVVITILLISVISGTVLSFVMSNTRIATSEERIIKANNLADAGIQYGISVLLASDIDEDFIPPSPESKNNPFGDVGEFSVKWERVSEELFNIISTGTYGKTTRTKTAGFELIIDDGSDGDGGNGGTGEPGGGSNEGKLEYWSEDRMKAHPWNYHIGEYVIYNTEVNGERVDRVFTPLNTTNHIPGVSYHWFEITNHYREMNHYRFENPFVTNSTIIVYYNSAYWLAKHNTNYTIPGELGMWRELTDEWRPYTQYDGGEVMSYNGKRYRAKYNAAPGPPDASNPYGPWELLDDSVVTLIDITISPSSSNIKEGEKIVFSATAHFSDGSTEDVTNKVIWTSSYPQIASMSGNVLTGIMDTGVEGCNSTLVSATYSYKHPTRNDIKYKRVGVTEIKVSNSGNSGNSFDSGVIVWEKETP